MESHITICLMLTEASSRSLGLIKFKKKNLHRNVKLILYTCLVKHLIVTPFISRVQKGVKWRVINLSWVMLVLMA